MVDLTPDSEHRGLARLPGLPGRLALMARLDRPIGWWLLYWPGAWGVALAGGGIQRWPMLLWLLLGAVAMRGAGCVYNDIVDRDLDARVARTRDRPLASGAVSVPVAVGWLVVLCLVGLVVLVQLRWPAWGVALASLAPVAAYPFMKRITGWPQAWLGIVFSWAALVGWSEVAGGVPLAGWLLYAGCIAWVVGYDTIYALQDLEDDALNGIGSSALSLGTRVRPGVAGFYAAALLSWGAAIWRVRPDPVAILTLLPIAGHLGWQVLTLRPADAENALHRFRANRTAGWLMFFACLVVGETSY
jgi:4-hydroxybenzoate polyprenyltransferase